MVDLWSLCQNFGPVMATYEGLLLLCECTWVGIILAGGGDT